MDATERRLPPDHLGMPLRHRRPIVLLTLSLLLFVSMVAARPVAHARARDDAAQSIPFPHNFREWALVKSSLVVPGHRNFETEAGFHHTYANAAALAGFRSGTFEDGAIIVAEAVYSKDMPGVVVEGERRRIDMMVRDSKRFATTGGWGWQQFKGTNETVGTVDEARAARCFGCHQNLSPKTFVIGTLR